MMEHQLDAIFSALADPTRRAIVVALAQRPELSVGELAAPFGISLPAISRHLTVLEDARLLTRIKQGRSVKCRLEPEPMEAAMHWLSETEKFWTLRLDALTALLEDTPWPKPKKSPSASSAPSKRRPKKSSPPGRIRKR